jgi:transcriptional regulator with XRE-family HTH domain
MKMGHILSKLRYETGLSQPELANALGVSKGAIGMWETDKRRPDYDMLIKIADFFNVSTDYILSHTVDSGGDTDSIVNISDFMSDTSTLKLVNTFNALNEDYQDILIGEAKKLLHRQLSEGKNKTNVEKQVK